MTISLEEHVARAIHDAEMRWKAENGGDDASIVDCPDDVKARAAIVAVREWEGTAAVAWLDRPGAPSLEELEAYRKHVGATSIRESERAACEAIAMEVAKKYLQLTEPMKRPTTRAYFEKAANALDHAADAIAARKGVT